MEFKDYYDVMGVSRDATQDEIKRAYRKLARKYHPDVSTATDAEARFKEIGEAYEVLKDPEKRTAYDQLGANWKAGQDFNPPPNWDQGFEFHSSHTGGGGQFSDFFEQLFGRRGTGGASPAYGSFDSRGEDTRARVSIGLEDAFHGATRTLTLKHTEMGADGRPQARERTLNVQIPKGVRQGQQIRLAGQGSPGVGRGQRGDLYLEIEFQPHAWYHADGKDIYLDLPITPWEAALGATLKVPTPAGKIDLKIPPNSSSGRKLRLKGRGIPATPSGDMFVVLQVTVPPANTADERRAFEKFRESFSYNPRERLGV